MELLTAKRLLAALAISAFAACAKSDGTVPIAPRPAFKPNFVVCSAPAITQAGIYPYFVMIGTIVKGKFTITPGAAHWQRLRLSASSRSSGIPNVQPKTPVAYLYVGTYSLKHSGQGCLDLWETKVQGTNVAAGSGYPQTTLSAKAQGPVLEARVTISHLKSSEPTGTVVLFNKNGARWDSGTITINHRIPLY